jgi:hypothetical protein
MVPWHETLPNIDSAAGIWQFRAEPNQTYADGVRYNRFAMQGLTEYQPILYL